jgi:hypothetical protein
VREPGRNGPAVTRFPLGVCPNIQLGSADLD